MKNWGTKWPASNIDFACGLGPRRYGEPRAGGELRAEWLLETPWGPPDGICRELRRRFPTLRIVRHYYLDYVDEGGRFDGEACCS